MTVKAQQGDALLTMTGLRVRIGGVLKTVLSGRVMIDDELKSFYTAASEEALSLSVSPESAVRVGFNSTVTSLAFTATPVGGTAPYSYAWTIVSYTGALPTALNPTFASSSFRQTGLVEGDSNPCVVRCTGTDAIGAVASDTAEITFERAIL